MCWPPSMAFRQSEGRTFQQWLPFSWQQLQVHLVVLCVSLHVAVCADMGNDANSNPACNLRSKYSPV